MNESGSWAISTDGLSKSYGDVVALDSLNLRVPKNSIFGFLGPNGAGKTTTMKLLLGLTRPTVGSATVLGSDITRDSVGIRRRIGYLAQNPTYYEHMTARETLRFRARFFYKGPKAAIEARIDETLGLVALADKADRPIRGFSGGELQRLGIAQAQINYPDLLFLDEPAANLDPMGRHDILTVMERLREHTTVFYCTHILGDVQRVSDTVAILNRGRLVAQAPIDELLAGSGGTMYNLVLEGDSDGAYARVAGQEWVSGIQLQHKNGQTSWQVTVTSEEVAKAELLGLLMSDRSVTAVEFGRRKYDLEEVFLSMIEEGEDVQH